MVNPIAESWFSIGWIPTPTLSVAYRITVTQPSMVDMWNNVNKAECKLSKLLSRFFHSPPYWVQFSLYQNSSVADSFKCLRFRVNQL